MNEIFSLMFPKSKIASLYAMSSDKMKYVIQFGIYPYVKHQLIQDLSEPGTPFTFKFDETTTSQVKKQYDGYVQFYSKNYKRIVTHYAGSLFLGHCTSEDLINHFMEFVLKLKCNINFFLHIGMDGPNVNLSFQKGLEKQMLEIHGKNILNI